MLFDFHKTVPLNQDTLEKLQHVDEKAPDATVLHMRSYIFESAFGLIEEINKSAAIDEAHAGAEIGDPICTLNFGYLLHFGVGIDKPDEALAKENIDKSFGAVEKLADEGNVYAQSLVGAGYACELGVPRDYAKGAHYLLLAAEAGEPVAQRFLAECYFCGQGVEVDTEKALMWLERSVASKFPAAQSLLGDWITEGEIVPFDKERILDLWDQAANAGHANTQFKLAK